MSPSNRQYRGIDFLIPKVFQPNEPLKLVGSAQIPKRHSSFKERNGCEIKCSHSHNPDIHKNEQR